MDRLDSLVRELRETAGTEAGSSATTTSDSRVRRSRHTAARSTPDRRRWLLLGLALLGLGAALLRGLAVTPINPVPAQRPASPSVDMQAVPTPTDWRAVVEELDRRRGLAFMHGSMEELRSVDYTPSAALTSDGAMMAALVRAGAHARAFPLRVTAVREEYVRVGGQEPRAMLTVTDVMGAYDIVDASGKVLRHVPARGERRWHVALRLSSPRGWLYVSAISAASP